jgi:hypothetical protein
MICQKCMEEYQFEGFKYDWESNRAFGNSKCSCTTKLVLPEEDCISMGLLDSSSREQLRHLRLLGLKRKLDGERAPNTVYLKALRAHKSVLVRYLAEVGAKGMLSAD